MKAISLSLSTWDANSIEDLASETVTVGGLISALKWYDKDALVVFQHDEDEEYSIVNPFSIFEYEENEDGRFEGVE